LKRRKDHWSQREFCNTIRLKANFVRTNEDVRACGKGTAIVMDARDKFA